MDPTSDNPERQTEDRAFSAPDSSAAEKRKTSDRPKSQMELELAREGGWVLKDKKEKEQIVRFHEVDNGHQFFPNQSEFGLESASCKIPFFLSKPNWNWFGKSEAFFGCIFSKPNWIWFGKGH